MRLELDQDVDSAHFSLVFVQELHFLFELVSLAENRDQALRQRHGRLSEDPRVALSVRKRMYNQSGGVRHIDLHPGLEAADFDRDPGAHGDALEVEDVLHELGVGRERDQLGSELRLLLQLLREGELVQLDDQKKVPCEVSPKSYPSASGCTSSRSLSGPFLIGAVLFLGFNFVIAMIV
jgi:hypothetical protein